jgi:hypothetical protein
MRKAPLLLLIAAVTLILTAADPAAAAPTLIGPTPYLSFSDSPFKSVSFSQFYLEDFESGQFNSPWVTAINNDPGQSLGVLSPGGTTDSVDADDGVIDGVGRGGHYKGRKQQMLLRLM